MSSILRKKSAASSFLQHLFKSISKRKHPHSVFMPRLVALTGFFYETIIKITEIDICARYDDQDDQRNCQKSRQADSTLLRQSAVFIKRI